jgi:hypothetical protein
MGNAGGFADYLQQAITIYHFWQSVSRLSVGRKETTFQEGQSVLRPATKTSSPRKSKRDQITMNIHEYQAKELLKEHGIAVPAGHAALSVAEAVEAAKQLPGPLYVVKAQIHAGGRGKGKFKELGADAKGGVRLAKSLEDVEAHAQEMLGNTLVTIQTGDAGKQVNRLYVTDGVDIASEYYLSLLVDRATGRVAFVVSKPSRMTRPN